MNRKIKSNFWAIINGVHKGIKQKYLSLYIAKFVYKKKGLEPGQVFLTKEKVLTVQPGIPADCEIIIE